MRFCMSSGEVVALALAALFLRCPGVTYAHDAVSPRFVQLSQGWPRLHFSFLCLQAPHDNGTRFLLRTTRNWGSGGDCAALEEVVDEGVGGMTAVC